MGEGGEGVGEGEGGVGVGAGASPHAFASSQFSQPHDVVPP